MKTKLLQVQKVFIDNLLLHVKTNIGLYDLKFTELILEQNENSLKMLNNEWENSIKEIISKISGSEFEEKKIWSDFKKLLAEVV